jgi:MSHA pilin protein MshD
VAQAALNGIAATESLLVTVTVTGPGETIQLQGYRTRHSPNLLP